MVLTMQGLIMYFYSCFTQNLKSESQKGHLEIVLCRCIEPQASGCSGVWIQMPHASQVIVIGLHSLCGLFITRVQLFNIHLHLQMGTHRLTCLKTGLKCYMLYQYLNACFVVRVCDSFCIGIRCSPFYVLRCLCIYATCMQALT